MKEQIEQQLQCKIPESLYQDALKYAKNKQAYIYAKERRKVVLQNCYLVKLTEEYVRNLMFSRFTMNLCKC